MEGSKALFSTTVLLMLPAAEALVPILGDAQPGVIWAKQNLMVAVSSVGYYHCLVNFS